MIARNTSESWSAMRFGAGHKVFEKCEAPGKDDVPRHVGRVICVFNNVFVRVRWTSGWVSEFHERELRHAPREPAPCGLTSAQYGDLFSIVRHVGWTTAPSPLTTSILLDKGLIEKRGGRVRATSAGRTLANQGSCHASA